MQIFLGGSQDEASNVQTGGCRRHRPGPVLQFIADTGCNCMRRIRGAMGKNCRHISAFLLTFLYAQRRPMGPCVDETQYKNYPQLLRCIGPISPINYISPISLLSSATLAYKAYKAPTSCGEAHEPAASDFLKRPCAAISFFHHSHSS